MNCWSFKRYPSTYCLIWTFYLQIRITTFKYGYKPECTCTFKFKRLITPLPSFLYNLQCLIMFGDSERTRYIILNQPVKDYNKVIIHVQKRPFKTHLLYLIPAKLHNMKFRRCYRLHNSLALRSSFQSLTLAKYRLLQLMYNSSIRCYR